MTQKIPAPPEKPVLPREALEYLHDWLPDGRDIEKLGKIFDDIEVESANRKRRRSAKSRRSRSSKARKPPKLVTYRKQRPIHIRPDMKRGLAILFADTYQMDQYNKAMDAWKTRYGQSVDE
jgi:hypothetical protein